MVRTQIQLTEKQSENLKRLAKVDNISMAEVIRRSVDAYIQTHQEISAAERERRLLSVIGIGQSGISDLGVNHDKHLADSYAEIGK